MKLNGLVVAAGESSRASGCKLLYAWEHSTILETVINKMKTLCAQVFVVTGAWHDTLVPVLARHEQVTAVYHNRWREGMLTSIRKGLQSCPAGPVLYSPADYPGISDRTYRIIAEQGLAGQTPCMAEFDGQAGPPVFLPETEVACFLAAGNPQSFRSWLVSRDVRRIPCYDKWVLRDVDTDDDYRSCL
ncbi:MAG: NTP transferase domain-containing protein [Spirochaetales bacterium]|nr:NTP transferase domain-containing protein [Spirochaetales bacterium]